MTVLDEVIADAREWLTDINSDQDAAHWSEWNVLALTNREFEGGLHTFVEDSGRHVPTVWLFAVRRFGLDKANRLFPVD